jgi:hypothetical protein
MAVGEVGLFVVSWCRVGDEKGCGAYSFASGEPGLSDFGLRLSGGVVDCVEGGIMDGVDGWCALAVDDVFVKKSVIGRLDPRVAVC